MNLDQFIDYLDIVITELKGLITSKNIKYNLSIMEDMPLWGKDVKVEERVFLRILEKVERLKNLSEYKDREEEYKDIAGYIINLLVYKEWAKTNG